MAIHYWMPALNRREIWKKWKNPKKLEMESPLAINHFIVVHVRGYLGKWVTKLFPGWTTRYEASLFDLQPTPAILPGKIHLQIKPVLIKGVIDEHAVTCLE